MDVLVEREALKGLTVEEAKKLFEKRKKAVKKKFEQMLNDVLPKSKFVFDGFERPGEVTFLVKLSKEIKNKHPELPLVAYRIIIQFQHAYIDYFDLLTNHKDDFHFRKPEHIDKFVLSIHSLIKPSIEDSGVLK